MPTALIADDEPLLREQIKLRLAKLWPELTIVAEATNGAEAHSQYENLEPDIVFLDIHMPVMNGLDAARLMVSGRERERRVQIVFITAFDTHAVEAFERGAIDYVLKPFNETRLAETIDRLKNRIQSAPSGISSGVGAVEQQPYSAGDEAAKLRLILRQLDVQIAQIKPGTAYLQWIKASVGQTVRLIPIGDVVYFQSDEKYTRVVLEDGEVLIRKPIKELIEELDPDRFWQIHRATIVNIHAIAGVVRGLRDQADLKLNNRAETLTVSRNYTHLFKQM